MTTIINAFNALPLAVQEEVKSALSTNNRCAVEVTASGEYLVITSNVIHDEDYNEILGEFTKNGISQLTE